MVTIQLLTQLRYPICSITSNIGVNLANQMPKSNHGPRKYLEGSYQHNMFFKPVLQTEVSTIGKMLFL